jgi:hypothetical protein
MAPTIIPHFRAIPPVLREVPTSDSLLSHLPVSHTASIAAHETGMRRSAGSLSGPSLGAGLVDLLPVQQTAEERGRYEGH